MDSNLHRFTKSLTRKQSIAYAKAVRKELGNAYNIGFISKNAVPSLRMVGDVLGIYTGEKTTQVARLKGRSGAQTPIQVPPNPPFSPEQWMTAAAMAAWQKFPERAASVGLMPPPYPTASTQIEGQVPPEDPTHTRSVVTAQRVLQYLLARFNPIRGLNPQRLATYLEQWSLGFLRWQALTWDQIRQRDSDIIAVVPKRIFAVSRLKWEIITEEESPEAEQHKQALEAAYKGITCAEALDQNTVGDVNLLIRQMMQAVFAKFQVHEIVWKPDVDVNGKATLTAHFRSIPLWFFENRTGQLRYLPYELALDGIPLDAGGWMITVGDGLHIALSIAYIYKQLGLRSWANFIDKYGMPFMVGKTDAAYGSPEWNQMVEALAGIRSDGSVLMSKNGQIEALDAKQTSEQAQERFLDRMSRDIARIVLGGDLSTHSRGQSGVGALPQISQEDELAEADAIMVGNALNFYFDRWVIRYQFGSSTPKARFRIIPTPDVDTEKEIAIDTFLLGVGVPLGIQDLQKRYGRPAPDEGEKLASPPAAPPGGMQVGKRLGESGSALTLGNVANGVAFKRAARRSLSMAQARALKPIADKIRQIADIENDEQRQAATEELKKDLPKWLGRVSDESGELVQRLEDIIGTSLVSGAVEAAARH